ncbi:hypothetical protein LTR62_007659 [Meristemomyces frigidus]|uniref:Uncharacterized protein n=1 Tax=Meristemomyces frigidus TaxID=1508187 RepID=A0AAN7TAU9_9PEZI|nr:hypothetical protein LTR62_007659 [Meristemomyces frigidus]
MPFNNPSFYTPNPPTSAPTTTPPTSDPTPAISDRTFYTSTPAARWQASLAASVASPELADEAYRTRLIDAMAELELFTMVGYRAATQPRRRRTQGNLARQHLAVLAASNRVMKSEKVLKRKVITSQRFPQPQRRERNATVSASVMDEALKSRMEAVIKKADERRTGSEKALYGLEVSMDSMMIDSSVVEDIEE